MREARDMWKRVGQSKDVLKRAMRRILTMEWTELLTITAYVLLVIAHVCRH